MLDHLNSPLSNQTYKVEGENPQMKKSSGLWSMFLTFGLIMSSKTAADPAVGAQNLTFSIPAVSVFSVSGDVAFGTFTIPVAGSDFSGIGKNSTLTYNVTNNAGNSSRKVSVQLGAALPTGMGIAMIVASPSGATSIGVFSPTSASATTAVTGIGNGAFSNVGIGMSIYAAVGTAAVGNGTIIATFTLTS